LSRTAINKLFTPEDKNLLNILSQKQFDFLVYQVNNQQIYESKQEAYSKALFQADQWANLTNIID
jgi:hypothetical protein